MPLEKSSLTYAGSFTDEAYQMQDAPTYYYLRATQQNNHIAWSSPVWIDVAK